MVHQCWRIHGTPYGGKKARGDKKAPDLWTRDVIVATAGAIPVGGPCILRVTFLLPPAKFPADLPLGPDLDNLAKRLLDALNETIFRDAPGKDSCVVAMELAKTRVETRDEAGAVVEVLAIEGSSGR